MTPNNLEMLINSVVIYVSRVAETGAHLAHCASELQHKVGLIDLIMEKNWGKEEKSRRKMEKSEG